MFTINKKLEQKQHIKYIQYSITSSPTIYWVPSLGSSYDFTMILCSKLTIKVPERLH